MALSVAAMSLVSPLALGPSEHAFFWRAEVSPHTSGAFTTRDGEPLPIHDCPFIPPARPLASRLRLLAKQALARLGPSAAKPPILLVAPESVRSGNADLLRFLALSGHRVGSCRVGAASFVAALAEAQTLLAQEPEVIVLAVDSLLTRDAVEHWYELRHSGFTRNPAPPSEGAAALRLVASAKGPLLGEVRGMAAGQSDATDDNDLLTDGAALTRVFADLALPGPIPLVVGPGDVDPLRSRDFHLAAVRHHACLDRAEMPSLEGRMGRLGSASGLMAAVFALAWLAHGLPLGEHGTSPLALAWARSEDGGLGAALLGGPRQ
jgi:hypothetical protein